MTDLRIKTWEKLPYTCPRSTLLAFREIEEQYDFSTTPYKISSLRIRGLDHYLEERQLALFCYGLSTIYSTEINYWLGEDDDYDGIAVWDNGYIPIQLKELPPERIGSPADLEEELAKLKTKNYSGGDLVVAYHLNRAIKGFNWKKLAIPDLDVAELWFFGSLTPDKNKWFIMGDMLNNPQEFEFDYPNSVD
jgi:hypothetical protein